MSEGFWSLWPGPGNGSQLGPRQLFVSLMSLQLLRSQGAPCCGSWTGKPSRSVSVLSTWASENLMLFCLQVFAGTGPFSWPRSLLLAPSQAADVLALQGLL